ncbi:MAG TPA: CPBP family intramembrane glutamic endopeptidase [Candidatus Binatia bacterium]|nr:CPBP family intramembrane glutamic endopeptidase [Candidatus Binatia bacterium]
MKTLFLGPTGVRAGWRFLAYVALLVGLETTLQRLAPFVLTALHLDENTLNAPAFVVAEIFEGVAVFGATAVLAAFERRRIDAYGLPVRLAFGRRFWEGVVLGALMAGGVAVAMIAVGAMVVHGVALHGADLIVEAVLWLVVMLLVGFNEEYMFRGYPLQALTRGIGFWPAAVVLSLLFGAAHLNKADENAIDIANIVVLGLLICLTLQRTGSLWLAVGFHCSFDFMQFFVIGTRNGGAQPVGHLLDVTFPGPAWANGGPLGTEASYFMLPAIALMLAYILVRYPKPRPLITTEATASSGSR